jgi:DME family drug/metabolite transporter
VTPPTAARGIGPVAVLGAALLWGTVGPAQVLAESDADPGALGVARLLIGGVALAAISSRGMVWRQLLRKDVIGWLLLAALATGIYQVAFMHAVDQLGAALGTAIALGVAPVVTGICARWWTHDRMTLGWAAGTAAAIIGCTVLLDPWGANGVAATGVAVALVSGACYGVYTVAAKRFLSTGVPALPATSFTLILAGILLSPIIALHPGHLANAESLLLIGWIGLAGTALAYALFVYGLGRTTAPVAGTLSLAEPLLAAVLGVVVLQEQLTGTALIGCALMIVGLVAVTVIDARRGRSPATRRMHDDHAVGPAEQPLCNAQ